MVSADMDFNPNFGVWNIYQHPKLNQESVDLTPERPTFRQLIEWLKLKENRINPWTITLFEEARAVASFCFRYGSYFHALTIGKPYPDFRKNQLLSRISDEEMKRINIESSAALAFILDMKDNNPKEYKVILQKVINYLPEAWTVKMNPSPDIGSEFWKRLMSRFPSTAPGIMEMREKYKAITRREEANSVANFAFRNISYIENLHAGQYSLGRDVPGYKRFYQKEIHQIMRRIIRNVEYWLDLRKNAPQDKFYYRVFIASHSPHGWSSEDETSTVFYDGWPNTNIKEYLPT